MSDAPVELKDIGEAKLKPQDSQVSSPPPPRNSATEDIIRAIQIVNSRHLSVFVKQESIVAELQQVKNNLDKTTQQFSSLLINLGNTQSELQKLHALLEALTSQNQISNNQTAQVVIQKYEEDHSHSINNIIENYSWK